MRHRGYELIIQARRSQRRSEGLPLREYMLRNPTVACRLSCAVGTLIIGACSLDSATMGAKQPTALGGSSCHQELHFLIAKLEDCGRAPVPEGEQ